MHSGHCSIEEYFGIERGRRGQVAEERDVVSHWPVSSRAPRHLMVEFHRRYRATPAAKAAALRQARLATLRDSTTRHPFYWSAFVLVGS